MPLKSRCGRGDTWAKSSKIRQRIPAQKATQMGAAPPLCNPKTVSHNLQHLQNPDSP